MGDVWRTSLLLLVKLGLTVMERDELNLDTDVSQVVSRLRPNFRVNKQPYMNSVFVFLRTTCVMSPLYIWYLYTLLKIFSTT